MLRSALVLAVASTVLVASASAQQPVAKLRATKTDSNPLYFKINMAGGHAGSSGRYDRLHEIAFRDAFILDAVGQSQQVSIVQ